MSAVRHPLIHNGRRIPGVFWRTTSSGAKRFEYVWKVAGQKRRQTLSASSPTDAIREADRLRPLVQDGRVGDRSARLEPTYRRMLEAMRDGSFTHGGAPYAARTIELLEQRASSHVLDALGRSTRVVDIRASHLRSMASRLSADDLSGSTVRGCLSVAATVLRYAVEQSIVDRNVASDIGRGERPSGKRKSEPRYLTVAEVDRLLGKLSDESRPIAAAMFFAGLRVSEALQLRWGDVGSDELVVRGTKTEASADTIPLLLRLAEELRQHRVRAAARGFDRVGPDELVFQTRSGRPVSRRNVLRAVHAAGRAAGLNPEGVEQVGCHDLRHSLAANALSLGLSITETSRLLRHSSPQVTSTVYAGITGDGVAALREKLAAL
jgi:integrase